MNILLVGGTGLIGGHAALYLQSHGHMVSVAGRTAPRTGTPLGELPFVRLDYVADAAPPSLFQGFDTLVFAAANDIRHVPQGTDPAAHWRRANAEGVPRFFAAARAAGIGKAVYVGTYYPQAAPHLVDKDAYIQSRKVADDAVRALASPGFCVCSVNPPFVVGTVPGLVVGMFKAYTDFAVGRFHPMPEVAPDGGVNFISTQSLSEAILGALLRGESGKAYLVGDENLSFQDYFGTFFGAVGRPVPPVTDQEHPLLPDLALPFGRGKTLYYEPDAAEARLLGYRRGDVRRAIAEAVAQYRDLP